MAEQQQYLFAAERERRARSFGAVAKEYERGRPSYPRAAIDWVLGERPLTVLDLGAGTGKLSAAVLAGGHDVIAVEPLAEMREVLRATLPQLHTLDGRAEHLPLASDSVDAVVVGAAFHWFEQAPALAEIGRVLRAPGILGLLGNAFDTSLAWAAALREILGAPAIEQTGTLAIPGDAAGALRRGGGPPVSAHAAARPWPPARPGALAQLTGGQGSGSAGAHARARG